MLRLKVHERRQRRLTFKSLLIVALAVATAMLGVASAAEATKPTGDFAVFSDCPVSAPGVIQCIYSQTTSGAVKLGKTEVPIVQTITLQGGVSEKAGTESFVAAADGNTLSKTPQKVPGGLLNLIRCNEISNFIERIACEVVFENGTTGVTATTELAAPASSIGINEGHLVAEEGTALSLPIKVKLENPFLGSECYIGSNAHPIVLNLTTGKTSPPPPNKAIAGSSGEFEFRDESEYGISRGISLVDNSFAVPGASGCGGLFAFLIDPIINSKTGVPAAAGNNSARLSDPLQIGGAGAVRASEK